MRATGARRFGRCVPARCTGAGQAVRTGAHRQADQQRLHERRAAPAEGRGRPTVERAGRSTQPASCLRVRASAERLAAAAPGGRIPWAVDASTASCQHRTPARPCPEFSAVGNLWCAAWLACRYRRRCGLPGAKRRTIGALPVEFERRTALMWTRAGNTVVRRIGIPATACTATGRTFAPTRSSRSPPKSHWKTAGADVALAEAQRGTAANRARTARIRELEDAPNAQIQIEDCDA